MDTQSLLAWCASYKRAWETQDPDLFVGLFTADCHYRDSPFTEPIPGSAFHAFWRTLATRQQDNHIEIEVLAWASGNRAILKWEAETTRRGTSERLEASGIFLLTFDSANLCSDVWEWQHSHPLGAPLQKPVGHEQFLPKL